MWTIGDLAQKSFQGDFGNVFFFHFVFSNSVFEFIFQSNKEAPINLREAAMSFLPVLMVNVGPESALDLFKSVLQ